MFSFKTPLGAPILEGPGEWRCLIGVPQFLGRPLTPNLSAFKVLFVQSEFIPVRTRTDRISFRPLC